MGPLRAHVLKGCPSHRLSAQIASTVGIPLFTLQSSQAGTVSKWGQLMTSPFCTVPVFLMAMVKLSCFAQKAFQEKNTEPCCSTAESTMLAKYEDSVKECFYNSWI